MMWSNAPAPTTPIGTTSRRRVATGMTGSPAVREGRNHHGEKDQSPRAAGAAARADVLADTVATLPAVVVTAAKMLDSTLVAVGGNPEGGRGFGGFRAGPPPPPTFVGVNGTLGGQINALENADMAPTPAMRAAYEATCRDLASAAATWRKINGSGGAIETFNAMATRNNLKPVGLTAAPIGGPTCANPVRAAARNRPATAARAQSNRPDADEESGDPEHESPENDSP